MATEADRVKTWGRRVASANKAYEEWAADFDVEHLERYYEGHQHPEDPESKKYTINMIFSGIEIKIPSLLYFRPQVHVIPAPPRADDPGTDIDDRCQMREDLAQTLMRDERVGFDDAHMLALRDSFFAFGVVEWGYSGDYIDNPNAGKPMLKDNSEDEMVDSKGETVRQPDQVLGPGGEFIYVRHIPACQFRAPAESTYVANHNDWLGYYEWVYTEDVKRNPAYKNRSQVKDGGSLMERYRVEYGTDPNRAGMVKLWKVWDLRAKKRYVWAENGDKFLLDVKFDVNPFRFLRPHPRTKSFYPIPPIYNWIDPQRELNDTRDSQRVHRKRMYRRYQALQDRIPAEELDKMETGGDGVIINVPQLDMIKPIQDAPLDQAVMVNVGQSREDFMYVSGVSGEQRGVSESSTATQANIIDTNAKIRDSYGRALVGKWLGQSIFTMLETARHNLVEPIMIMMMVDPIGPGASQETDRVKRLWKEITMDQLGDSCYEVVIDVEALSPVSQDQMRDRWMQVLSMLTQPTLMMAMLASPTLFKKTLNFYGVTSDRERSEIGNAMQQVLSQMAAGKSAPAGPGQPGVPSGPTPQGGPDVQQIMQALSAQMGQPGGRPS
jgi:hypothetical protein